MTQPLAAARDLGTDLVTVVLRQSPPVLGAAMLAGWTLLVADRVGGRPENMVQTCGVAAGAYVAGLVLHRLGWLVGPLVAVAVAAWFVTTEGAFSGRPTAGPLGYGNANGALLVAAAAACAMAVAHRSPTVRAVGVLGCAAGVALVVPTRSAAALGAGLAVLAAAAVGFAGRAPRDRKLGTFVLVAAALPTLTVLLATRPWLPGLDSAAQALTMRRVALWTDAVNLLTAHPAWGTGPRTFAFSSATAASDTDTTAAHSLGLEVAAELGYVGAALLALTVVAVLAAARLAARRDAAAALVASVAWVALSAHAAIDYVADFPEVVGVAAFVAGLGSVLPRPARPARTAPRRPDPGPTSRGAASRSGPDPSR